MTNEPSLQEQDPPPCYLFDKRFNRYEELLISQTKVHTKFNEKQLLFKLRFNSLSGFYSYAVGALLSTLPKNVYYCLTCHREGKDDTESLSRERESEESHLCLHTGLPEVINVLCGKDRGLEVQFCPA